jgi:hypothetical protein
MLLQPIGGGLSDVRVVGEPQIVVGAEIEDLTLCYANLGSLRAEYLPLRFVEACRADFNEPFRNSFFE